MHHPVFVLFTGTLHRIVLIVDITDDRVLCRLGTRFLHSLGIDQFVNDDEMTAELVQGGKALVTLGSSFTFVILLSGEICNKPN